MLDLAKHIVELKAGHFAPAKFKDHYESELQELLNKKQKGQPIAAAKKSVPSNVYNLMDALKSNISGKTQSAPAVRAAKTSKKVKAAKAVKRKAS
jgi:DNA end-binding protein Ku